MAITAELRARVLRVFMDMSTQADALDLEHACFWTAHQRAPAYRHQALRVVQGLERGKLRDLVLQHGALKAISLGTEEVYGSDPHRETMLREDARQAEALAFLHDLTRANLVEVPDAGIRCRRCGSNDIAFEFLQTRSADEGTTTYCTCVGCANRWRM